MHRSLLALGFFALTSLPASAQPSFVNWENPHVHPLDLTPDHTRLLAVNTPDDRLEVFDVTSGTPVLVAEIAVGIDPVSVRARSNGEAWVVNHISDSVSIVDLSTMNVRDTISTADEPADVVFAGSPQRAFVSCSQANLVQVFDPASLETAPAVVPIDGEDPRGMAVNGAGTEVYVAIFESGNATTVLGGGAVAGPSGRIGFPPNVVSDPNGPYAGVNPPPNSGASFSPPQDPNNPAPPPVSLIVRRNGAGQWMDDNGGDWTSMVSGANASASGRLPGWDLVDHDLAIIDTTTLNVRYATGLMNICMALGVNPANGQVTVVGTEATNEVRFEPVVSGKFTRIDLALVDPSGPTRLGVVDLNSHLSYATSTIPQTERDKSLGDPRGIVWNAAGDRGYVTGMGSNNLIIIDAAGARAGTSITTSVGEGPTGLALDESRSRLYVMDKFASAISVVSTATESEVTRVPFFDPSPTAIKVGRKHLYDTHKNSGLGQIACASCHVDGRMDRIGWDLGNPTGAMKSVAGQNLGANIPGLNTGFQDFHPMKGPMTTQTLQDIIGHEPFHWRGDRNGLEEFNGAFIGLQGDDTNLTPTEMLEFKNFLATIYFPPNPFRNFDNTLSTSVSLAGHYTTGRFAAAGATLGAGGLGNAVSGLAIYRPPRLLDSGAIACVQCHTLPTGAGTDTRLQGLSFQPIPPGPNGEHHLALVSVDGLSNVSMKIPQLRNEYEKTGFNLTQLSNTAGFGVLHDGSVDSLERFVAEPVFNVSNDQEIANLVAFMLSLTGSGLPVDQPPGPPSHDSHAAVGRQTTVLDGSNVPPAQGTLITQMITFANNNAVGLVVKGKQGGIPRGWMYIGSQTFQSDRAADTISVSALRASASAGNELTYTVVPRGTQTRIGVDRDGDGFFDRDEIDAFSDPSDPNSTPLTCRKGNVNGGVGPITDVLFVNGSPGPDPDRKITVTPATPFNLTIQRAPSGGSRYALYAWIGDPRPNQARQLPLGIGISCMPTPLNPGAPQPRKIANNTGAPALGVENWPGPPTHAAPYTLLNLPGGLGRLGTFFVEGLMVDSNAPNGRAAVTNGIVVVSQ
ncbi:MAG: YncE family protein [Planctomycetes bacterium]|nr:YncE family protein [Planctomycetota bacterium]